MKTFTRLLRIIAILALLSSCGSGNEVSLPEVETFQANVFNFSSATLRGEVFSRGGSELISRGFCYGETGTNIRNNCQAVEESLLGEFELEIEGLSHNSTFEFEAFAQNEDGRAFGSLQMFSTGEKPDWAFVSQISFEDVYSITFANEDLGWAAGNDGKIFITNNGGQNWAEGRVRVAEDLIDERLDKVHLINSSNGWAIGSEGTFYKTSNADTGFDWEAIQTGATEVFLGRVDFVGEDHIAFISDGNLFISTDSGETWTERPTFQNTFKISFPNLNTLVVFEDRSEILLSRDLGRTWTDISTQIEASQGFEIGPGGLDFINDDIGKGTIMNENSIIEIISTDNGGGNWDIIYSDQNERVGVNTRNLYFIDENEGWIPEELLKTVDGGLTWQEETKQSGSRRIEEIFFLNRDNIWGRDGRLIFKYTN